MTKPFTLLTKTIYFTLGVVAPKILECYENLGLAGAPVQTRDTASKMSDLNSFFVSSSTSSIDIDFQMGPFSHDK